MVILEPRGLEMYRKYCGTHRWQMFSIYVETPENVRLDRLAKRTTNDIMKVVSNNNWFSDVGPYRYTSAAEVITQLIQTNNKRLKAVLDEERQWSHTNRWDVQVDGTNLEKSLEYIKHAIQNRNNRQDIYK
jgi:uridine kinase